MYHSTACQRVTRGIAKFSIFLLALVAVSPVRAQQFRAAWADVFHVGMQTSGQVDTMVNALVAGRYNAVIVQAVAYMDNATLSHGAYYKSSILPWSGYTTAGFDPLAYLITKAHANNIEVHAWLGGSGGAMYRVSSSWPPAGNSTLAAHPEWMMVPQANSEGNAVVAINGNCMLDMGSADAQEYIVSIVRELVTNYAIDGIDWDDEHDGTVYALGLGFPAYNATTFPRSGLGRYRANTGFVGTPGATDAAYNNYRRRFKNELMARCQAEIQSIKTNPRQPVRHTSSVMAFGGPPATCTFTSEEAYTYYSDWPTMLQNGWLDAAIPMNYKALTNNGSLYNSYCDRAFSCWRYNRHIFMGLAAYMNPRSNTLAQLQYAYFTNGYNGGVTYSYNVPYATSFDSAGDWYAYVAANLYTSTATTPSMPWRNPATATQGIVWGRVRDGATGNYIDDATVTVTGSSAVKTDGNGYYIATLVSATTNGTAHSTTASKTAYVSQTILNATAFAADVARYDFLLNMPAPSGLAASGLSSNQIGLSWINNGTNATATVVSRSTTSGGPYTDIASLAASATTYTNTGLSPSTTYYYVVRATNSYGNSTSSAQAFATTSAAGVAPGITAHPQTQTVGQGSNATFIVTATGTAPLYYQWRFNSTNLPGATASSFTRSNAQPPDAGPYSVVVSNSFGTSNSATATLTVTPLPPTITQDPISRAAVPGGYSQFAVAASGSSVLYQWQRDQTNLPGATSAILVLSNLISSDFGPYRAVAANPGGSATSAVAQLSMAVPQTLIPEYFSNAFILHFGTEFGPVYAVEYKQALDDPSWTELARTNGTGAIQTIIDPAATNPATLYRLQIQ
jgi:uncharacterized lipoprotein YddW (UPF0748 family)